jgi:flagellar biosynthesis protein FliQ
MAETALFNALTLFVKLVLPLLGVLLLSGVLAGVLQTSTQIEDRTISLATKFAGLFLIASLWSTGLFPQLISFTQSLWGGAEFYR